MERLFGGKLARELDDFKKKRKTLAENHQVLLKERNKLTLELSDSVAQLSLKEKEHEAQLQANIKMVEALIKEHKKAMLAQEEELSVIFGAERLKLLEHIKALSTAMPAQLKIPNADDYMTTDPVLYEPFKVSHPAQIGLIADAGYLAFTLVDWKALLKDCQKKTKQIVGKYKKNVADCDDFAVVMSAIVVGAFAKSKFEMQGAFFFTRSRTHAYNVFVVPVEDNNGNIGHQYAIFEPQNGTYPGYVGQESLKDMYKSTEMWLLGAELPPS